MPCNFAKNNASVTENTANRIQRSPPQCIAILYEEIKPNTRTEAKEVSCSAARKGKRQREMGPARML